MWWQTTGRERRPEHRPCTRPATPYPASLPQLYSLQSVVVPYFCLDPIFLTQLLRLHHSPIPLSICTPSNSILRHCFPIGLAWLVSLSLSSAGLHDSPMSSLAHPSCGPILPGPYTSLAPLCRTQGLLEQQGKKANKPQDPFVSFRRAEGPLPDSPPQL